MSTWLARRIRVILLSKQTCPPVEEVEVPPVPEPIVVPDWATFDNNDASCWKQVLTDLGADERSQQELFSLAQRDDRGWKEANDLISKILKFHTQGCYLKNTSAYIHSSVLNVRHAIWQEEGKQGWWYK